jgi:hypothetical protein
MLRREFLKAVALFVEELGLRGRKCRRVPEVEGGLHEWWRNRAALGHNSNEAVVHVPSTSASMLLASVWIGRRRRIRGFVDTRILAGDKLQTFAFDDDYSFGILQSVPHLVWYQAKAARLKNEEDYNYSAESVYETFPWPQDISAAQFRAVAGHRRSERSRGGAVS